MRNQFLLLFLFLIPLVSFSQDDFYDILNKQNHFPSIVAEAEKYFETKHPGLTNSELCQGEHRDGTFVKYMRWKNFWKDRLNEDGTLGDITAYFRNKNVQARDAGPFDDMDWTNFGIPKNLGGQVGVGRTTGIDFHPTDKNIFVVSTGVGGIWRTEDGGKTYTNIGDNLPTLAVGTVLMDHTDTNIIYASTGDRINYGIHGIGVYKSINGGEDWQPTGLSWAFEDQVRIYKMAMHPQDQNTIYAATDNGLFKTTDGFETVENIDSVLAHDVIFKPKEPSTVYYTSDFEFRKSTDNGETFHTVHESFNGLARICVSEADPERVHYTKGSLLFKSYDSGEQFNDTTNIELLNNRAYGYVSMSNINPDILYGGYFSTWKSEDDGDTWNEITCFTGRDEVHVDNHFAAQNPLEPGYVYFCNDGGLYKFTENPCIDCESCYPSYEDLSAEMYISQFYDISNSQQNINIVSGGTQDNSSYYRNKYGSWEFFAPTGDGMTNHIDPTDDNYKYWEYQFGTINRNSDGRNSCISCTIPNNEGGNGAWETPYILDPNNPEVIMAGYTRVYRSEDRGNTWTQSSSILADGNVIQQLKIAPSNSDFVYAAQGSNLFLARSATNNTILNWFQRDLPYSEPTSLVISQNDEEKIYITRGGYIEGGKVYMSSDQGRSWENISINLPNVPAHSIVNLDDEDYDDVLILATDAGVFYKDASMDQWEEYGSLPHTFVEDVEVQLNSKLIRIGTHGRSMFEAPLPDNVCLAMDPPDSDGDGVCDAYDICEGGDDNIDQNLNGKPDHCETPCFSMGIDTTLENYINYFALGPFTNISGQSNYSDFTHFTIDIRREGNYFLDIGLEEALPDDNAFAWIDFNGDDVLTDDELLVLDAFNIFNTARVAFTVPADAELGRASLRIRTMQQDATDADPCGVFIGEVEDYTVRILEADITSVESNGANFGFELFPNPSKNIISIKTQAYQSQEVTMEIVSMDGRTIHQTGSFVADDGSIETIDISKVPTGLYFVKLRAGKYRSVKKLVVTK